MMMGAGTYDLKPGAPSTTSFHKAQSCSRVLSSGMDLSTSSPGSYKLSVSYLSIGRVVLLYQARKRVFHQLSYLLGLRKEYQQLHSLAKLNSVPNSISLFVSVMCMRLCVCAGTRGQPPCCSSGALRRALTGLSLLSRLDWLPVTSRNPSFCRHSNVPLSLDFV